MICKICQKEFTPQHFNQKLCSLICKKEASRERNRRYKKSEKGNEAYKRWCMNPAKKIIDKKYRQTDKAKRKSVIRTKRFLSKHPEYKQKMKEYQKNWIDKIGYENYRSINNNAIRKYRKTDKGRWQAKTYKYRLRNNEAGEIDKELWDKKLIELEGKCQICGKTENITIDHIIPLSKNGTNHIDNLQPLCRSCNCRKNNKL